MDKKIDLEGILNRIEWCIDANKEGKEVIIKYASICIRQSIPIILQIAAESANYYVNDDGEVYVDKQSILNSEEEIIKQLGL